MASRIVIPKSDAKRSHRASVGVPASDLLAREGREPVQHKPPAHAAAYRGALAATTGVMIIAGALSVVWSDGQDDGPSSLPNGALPPAAAAPALPKAEQPSDGPLANPVQNVAMTSPAPPPPPPAAPAPAAPAPAAAGPAPAPVARQAAAPAPKPVAKPAPRPAPAQTYDYKSYRQYVPVPALSYIDRYSMGWG
ncbi:hypothetical protein EV193_1115 [Herbihabitans rhizosphaerae]|uniref:Uncharacterized protein n=1 Tax=Herbihabitans rhizosphaerae TaxID=1872711 RepID=A0A4V2ERP1_9PSEU|nr:hypothetical protein [Herbihabitans rhizosphaerae]RZS32629.1 hypothetical protein EV193_1115 [Herbihabitans rhizosphaerae]